MAPSTPTAIADMEYETATESSQSTLDATQQDQLQETDISSPEEDEGIDDAQFDDYDDDDDDEEDVDESPRYTPQELGAIFLDFYQFLASLHFDPANLKIPPPEGWSGISRELVGDTIDDFALEVMRHLPYFSPSNCPFEYKSELIDFTIMSRKGYDTFWELQKDCEYYTSTGDEVELKHIFVIAKGHESGGVDLRLDTLHGELAEELVRMGTMPEGVDVRVKFEQYKEKLRKLVLIPCPGRIMLDLAVDCPSLLKESEHEEEEEDAKITEEQFRAQKEQFSTELDIRYLRQVYREHGWPHAFRREQCFEYINELMESIEEDRGGWEECRLPQWM